MRDQGYHPVFDTDPTCMLHYALQLKQKGMIKESEERMKKLIANPDYHLFDLTEEKAIFWNLLHLSVVRVNRWPGGLNEKLLKYREILKIVLPGTIINRQCHNELIEEIILIKKQIEVKISENIIKPFYGKCPKLEKIR
tara:strand:- start:30421 stop:30837 length:417 start_codon:yes stop_codon:yes gene_type:complete